MAVHWRIPVVACVLLSFLSVRWMLKTDELDPCRCMSSAAIRNRAPLDSIPLAAARTEEETMLVPAPCVLLANMAQLDLLPL